MIHTRKEPSRSPAPEPGFRDEAGGSPMLGDGQEGFRNRLVGRYGRQIGLYAVLAMPVSFVISSLLALAYFATDDGAEVLEVDTVSAWAEPARDLAGWLLTFASPDTVYFTYLKSLLLVSPAVLLCALLARSRRPTQVSAAERWGWRVALVGYGAYAVAPFIALPYDLAINLLYFAVIIPGTLLAMIGSTILGVAFFRSSYRPRLTAVLLIVNVPVFIIGSGVLGHNSLGDLAVNAAWAITGWHLYRSETSSPASDRSTLAAL